MPTRRANAPYQRAVDQGETIDDTRDCAVEFPFEIDYWYAVLGPAGMPRPIVDQLQRDIAAIVNAPETRESLRAQGSIAVGSTPQELTALIRREYELWSKVVKAGGVKVE